MLNGTTADLLILNLTSQMLPTYRLQVFSNNSFLSDLVGSREYLQSINSGSNDSKLKTSTDFTFWKQTVDIWCGYLFIFPVPVWRLLWDTEIQSALLSAIDWIRAKFSPYAKTVLSRIPLALTMPLIKW